MAVVKAGYQELRGNDIYSWVKIAPTYARRGGQKWVRFWLFDWLQLQGSIQIPANSKPGDLVKVLASQIYEQFSLQEIRDWHWSGNLKPEPRGDVYFVIEYK